MAKPGSIRIGVGGWTYEPWRGVFYPDKHPQKDELAYASRALTSIEINGTYYGAQKPETFAKWREETPEGFVFSVKAPRYATNRKVLADASATIERFFAGGIMELREKLGPTLWQFMPTKRFDPADLESFLKLLPESRDGQALRHAVEVRHDSFRTPNFVDLAHEYGVAIVSAFDSEYPLIADITAPFVYTRVMGTKEGEPLGYPAPTLQIWAERAQSWAKGEMPKGLEPIGAAAAKAARRDVYFYVISGHKESNPAAARAMLQLVA